MNASHFSRTAINLQTIRACLGVGLRSRPSVEAVQKGFQCQHCLRSRLIRMLRGPAAPPLSDHAAGASLACLLCVGGMLRSYWTPGGGRQRPHSSASAGWKHTVSTQVLVGSSLGSFVEETLAVDADVDGENAPFCPSVL